MNTDSFESMLVSDLGALIPGFSPGKITPESSQLEPAMNLAAAAWLVDKPVYEEVLQPVLGESCPSFESLVQHPDMESVPRMPGVWRVRESRRESREAQWVAGSGGNAAQLYRSLAERWQQPEPGEKEPEPVLALHFLLKAAAPQAMPEWQRQFHEADEAFDLDRCRQLLLMAKENGMPVDDQQRRLAARSLFATEWYKTGRYYRRKTLHDRLSSFLAGNNARWLLPVHAAGGMGKTMMLRAWIARDLVPGGVPVARVDFDDVHWRHFEQAPWLLLLPLAEQLAVQLPAPGAFKSILDGRESWSPWLAHGQKRDPASDQLPPLARPNGAGRDDTMKDLASKFTECIPGSGPLVIIFDTTEEPYLHGTPEPHAGESRPRGALPALLEMMEKIHALRPGLRVVLSGRYDLFGNRADTGRERIARLSSAFGGASAGSFEVRGFSLEETRNCLSEACRLDLSDDVEKAIFEKAAEAAREETETPVRAADPLEALPFDVDFWAREAAGNPGIKAEEIRHAVSADYPIKRIIARIPRVDVQWLVRYAVVPLRMTAEFLQDVLLDLLREVMDGQAAASSLDRGRESLPEQELRALDIWRKDAPLTETSEGLWKALTDYASGPNEGWLEVKNGAALFHPRVRKPMRELLEKEAVWPRLQQRAQAYYLKRANAFHREGQPAEWGEEAAAALFHAFQKSAAAGERLWRQLRLKAAELSWSAAIPLTKMILGAAGFQPGEKRQPLLAASGTRRVSDALEKEVREEELRSLLWQGALSIYPAERRKCLDLVNDEWLSAANFDLQKACAALRQTDPGGPQSAPPELPVVKPEQWHDAQPDAALALLSLGALHFSWQSPHAAAVYDDFLKWAQENPRRFPGAVAAALAARVASADGRTGDCVSYWELVMISGPAAWKRAAAWLGETPADLMVGCGFDVKDAWRPDLAQIVATGLRQSKDSEDRAWGLVIDFLAAQRRGEFCGSGGFKALEQMTAEMTTRAGQQQTLLRVVAMLWRVRAPILLRQEQLLPALDAFKQTQDLWKRLGDHDALFAGAVAECFSMLEAGDLRAARIALEPVPRENSRASRWLSYPWTVSSLTATVLLEHCHGRQPGPELMARIAALPDRLPGRWGPHARVEMEAACLAAGLPVMEELLRHLEVLQDPVSRAAALWPLKFAATPPEGAKLRRNAKLEALFCNWPGNPAEVPEYQLLQLVNFADFLRMSGKAPQAKRAIRHVLAESARLQRPWLWREAALAADRAGMEVRSIPPLPEAPDDPLMATPFAARLLLEVARRAFRRSRTTVWRKHLIQARKLPGWPEMQSLPHAPLLREFEADLALFDGTVEAAITNLHGAADAWDEMENVRSATACRDRARTLNTNASAGSAPESIPEMAPLLSTLLNAPPPLLELTASGGRLTAVFQPHGQHLGGTLHPDALPAWLLQEGTEALSLLHYRLKSEHVLIPAMGNLLTFPPDALPDGFLRLHSDHALVMVLPWECVRQAGSDAPLPYVLCRRSTANWPAGRLVRWVQNALNRLGAVPKLVEDGIVGPLTGTALAAFWQTHSRESAAPDAAKLLRQVAKSLAALETEQPLRTVGLAGGRNKASGYDALRELRPPFSDAFADNCLSSADAWKARLIVSAGAIEDQSDSSDTMLQTEDGMESPGSLARMLDSRGTGRERSVVFLHTPLSRNLSPEENERHLLRRNLFAHRLYSTGGVLAVIAASTPDTPSPALDRRAYDLAKLAAGGGSLRDAVALFHASEGGPSPFGGHTTALWAPHPDLPLMP